MIPHRPMFDVARTITLASFPPGLSEIETKRRLCQRLYGTEVHVEAYIEHLVQLKNSCSYKPSYKSGAMA